jgi:hypothetical protein
LFLNLETDHSLRKAGRNNLAAAIKELLMEPAKAGEQGGIRELRLDLLRRAAEIYLDLAYPAGAVPEVIQRRLVWREGCAAEGLLSGPPFERAGKGPGSSSPIYALRLGNHRYPHMKLQIQTWPNAAGFMLSVNTHDQVSGLDLGAADVQAFRDLQADNQRLKERIEQSWDEAELPTFLRYLRDYIKNQTTDLPSPGFEQRSGASPPGAGDLTSLA